MRGLVPERHDPVASVEQESLEHVRRKAASGPERATLIQRLLGAVRDPCCLSPGLQDEVEYHETFVEEMGQLLNSFEQVTGIPAELVVAARWPSRLATDTARNLYRIVAKGLDEVLLQENINGVCLRLDSIANQLLLRLERDGRRPGHVTDAETSDVLDTHERVRLVSVQARGVRGAVSPPG